MEVIYYRDRDLLAALQKLLKASTPEDVPTKLEALCQDIADLRKNNVRLKERLSVLQSKESNVII